MATGQTLLDTMEVLDQELQLQAAETDVTRGLIALNRAQDYFESLVAQEEDLLGDTVGTVTTTASTETTTFPSGVLRVDRLSFIDATTSLPSYDLESIKRVGGARRSWLFNLVVVPSAGTGQPEAYWTDGRKIYWSPLPNATHTVRWYGFQVASDISASGTFAYPDICILPFATFATTVMKVGVGDEVGDFASLAEATFRPVIKTLGNFDRDGARPYEYSEFHTT